ncbi:hypothetical protein E8E12_004262 [Didymella heteroderae]|uniref:Nuclear pore complex NUP2/50/61 domain-containing protein n=2 Tax=Eukaryota TaxID=2759 RepID=A0A9P4WI32_9PLEO|nr:hypothetical protein E8E12_004262 [Didymella heteroderae]
MSGKRANLFGQGRAEDPYNERDEPADAPQRATAAQLAARKIKTAKPRRAAGATSGLSQSVNFGGAQQASGFNFGASAPIGGGAENGANASGGMFGGFGNSTTNSFPPPAPASDSNSMFANNSFTFGADNQSSTQQSGGGFNFSAGTPTHNPFGALNGGAPATNGASTAFGGSGSIFGSQPASNPFGGLQNNTSSASGSTSMFGTTNGASSTPFSFGGASSSAAPEPSTPAPASPFNFGGNTAAPSTSSFQFGATPAPAAASTGFQFGANTSTAAPAATPAPASTGIFNFGGGATQNGSATPAPAPAFGGFGATSEAQKGESTPAATPASTSTGLFNFGAAATPKPAEPATPAPAANMFGGATTPAPASNLFSSLKPAESNTPKFSFGQTQEASKVQESTPKFSFGQTQEASKPAEPASDSTPKFSFGQTQEAPKPAEPAASTPKFSFGQTQEAPKEPTAATPNFFNSVKPTEPETPKTNPFGGLPKPADTPAPNFSNMFGASQNKDSAPKESEKPASTSLFQAPEAPKTSLFSGFGTPQPAKTAENEQAKAGMFTAPPKASGFTFGAANTQEAATPSKVPEAPLAQETPAQQPAGKEPSNPFASLLGSSSSGGGLFGTSPTPAKAAAPTLNTSATPQLPKIGKLNVPKDWVIEEVAAPQNADETSDYIIQLATQLQHMNLKYREMISKVSPLADWSNLSIWHHTQSRALKTKIDDAKKQRAAAKGVTGFESALSTKRKVNEDTSEESSKRSRPTEPSTPTPKSSQPPMTTPKAAPPATATSNLFSKAISKGATPEKSAPEPPKAAAPSTGFTPSFSASAGPSAPKPSTSGFTPSFSASTGTAAPKSTPAFGATNGTDASKSTSSSTGFTPSFGVPKASTASTGFTPSFGAPKAASSGGFTPTFGGSSSGGSTDFMAAFAKKAKTYEQLAAERKKKAKDEDFDSDDETEEEWSARYDKEEAERLAKEKEAVASASGFSLPASTNASGATTPTPEAAKESAKEVAEPKPSASTNLFANLAKPTSGASTPNMFRAASPAPSTSGGRSVFDTPAAPSPSGNLFGHLSSGPSSAHQDDTDEDEDEHDDQSQAVGSTGSTSPKRRFGDSETESDDASTKKQDTAPKKGSLLSRMTRADDADSEAEKENDKPGSVFGQTNGNSTPTNKPFAFFNFDAAGANTAPPKNTFAGDQTFKVGSPIKFGGAPATEKKKDGPTFQFQPATPSPAEFSTTPAKPPPSGSLFSFGGASGSSLAPPNFGASAPSSVPSSVFSSRAGTPAAESEANKDSAAADDEEGEKHEQVDLSQLTAEEKETTDVVFHIDLALAKQQVDQGDGTKKWENFARGPLWILKDKVSGKCFVRIRIPSGATPLNYQILPALRSTVAGGSRKMVQATRPGKDKGLTPVYFAVKSPEVAEEFSKKYNESMPSN